MVAEEAIYRHVGANPAFHELKKRHSRFSWTLVLVMLGTFYSFIFVVAFKPELFAIPLHERTVITWGIVAALSVMGAAQLLTAIYVIRANRDFDPNVRSIIDDAMAETEVPITLDEC